MNLILLDPSEVERTGFARLADGRATHIKKVLRATTGQKIRLGVVDGPFGVGTVTAIDADAVELTFVVESQTPPVPHVDLLLALPRPKVLRRLWAQLAAIGVGRVILTNAEKVERDYFDTHYLDVETYRPLLIEGLQQAKDTRVPQVSIHKRFKVLIEDELDALCPQMRRLVAHPSEQTTPGVVSAERPPETTPGVVSPRTLLAIGPEGGWNDFELALLAAHGFAPISLGPRPLRTDTACIAALTLVHAMTAVGT